MEYQHPSSLNHRACAATARQVQSAVCTAFIIHRTCNEPALAVATHVTILLLNRISAACEVPLTAIARVAEMARDDYSQLNTHIHSRIHSTLKVFCCAVQMLRVLLNAYRALYHSTAAVAAFVAAHICISRLYNKSRPSDKETATTLTAHARMEALCAFAFGLSA